MTFWELANQNTGGARRLSCPNIFQEESSCLLTFLRTLRNSRSWGRNLYAAMRSDFEVNPNASALPIDYFEHIIAWYQAHKDDTAMLNDVMEACGRAGLSASDVNETPRLRGHAVPGG